MILEQSSKIMDYGKYRFWNGKEGSTKIDVVCFLPNGICITFPFLLADTPLNMIKKYLWEEAERFALFRLLKAPHFYVFEAVSEKGGTEELLDENLSLFYYKPLRPYLKVVARHGDEDEKSLKSKITKLLGRNISNSKNLEVVEFRNRYKEFSAEVAYKRGRSTWEQRAIYTYPPEYIAATEKMPEPLSKLLVFTDWHLTMSIRINTDINTTLHVFCQKFPSDVIKMALEKKAKHYQQANTENPQDYILKVFGKMHYLLGSVEYVDGHPTYKEIPLISYMCIRDCLLWKKPIQLQLTKKFSLDVEPLVPKKTIVLEGIPPVPPKKNLKKISLWDISPTTMFKLKVVCASNVYVHNMTKQIICGIFHGSEELCEPQKTTIISGVNPQWNESLEFDIPVSNLPRMAKLCFSIIGYRRGEPKTTIAWVNVPIMDFRGNLKSSGLLQLYCWPNFGKIKSENNYLNPIGTVASNEHDGTSIVVEIMRFANQISYPHEDDILELAINTVTREGVQSQQPPTSNERLLIEDIIKKDSLASFEEDPKAMELLWKYRFVCCIDYPESLSKLLQAMKWSKKENVAQMYYLLTQWRSDLNVEIALDVLDYRFPDDRVRRLAVRTLETLTDGELELYLMQLTQALRYESYLDSPLALYLLKRALNNRRIGHFLFWHLRAEITNPNCSLQFSLLLEMYCHGAVSHVDVLLRQVEAVNKLKTASEVLKSCRQQDRKSKLHTLLNTPGYCCIFENLISPLNPSILLKRLKVTECKFMSSAKKPIWLVFENADVGAQDISIIFKNGDDLRQDMLTVISLRIMENIWKKQGLDYGLIPYQCLSTGPMVGLVEVVLKADTLARIQAKSGKLLGTLRSSALYDWMVDQQNNLQENVKTCVANFTRSVVGYSVATFVLGIGDRHNDNVMLKQDTGQLFHIDFGHFLGNFKSKFGIRRERVKFVLPDEFIYIIQKMDGNKSPKENFERFKEMCVEAYQTLRRNGNLFITIFAMLLSTGIPELKEPSNLDYIRESFALNSDETEAIKHFEGVFKEAYDRRASTSLMWTIHTIKHY